GGRAPRPAGPRDHSASGWPVRASGAPVLLISGAMVMIRPPVRRYAGPPTGLGETGSRGRRTRVLLALGRGALLGRLLFLRGSFRPALGDQLQGPLQRHRLDRVALAQRGVDLPVRHVRAPAAVLDDHRLAVLRRLPELPQDRKSVV